MWLTIGLTVGFAAETWWLKILLAVVAVDITVRLIKIKTLQQEPANSSESVEAS